MFHVTQRSIKYKICQFGVIKYIEIDQMSRLKIRNSGVDILKLKKIVKNKLEKKTKNKSLDDYQDFDTFIIPN